MYFDISPLALSFDHCAYLAEKRYYFHAGEYFSQQDTTTPDSRNESTPSADTSVSAETSAAATKPQIYTAPENYTPVTSNIQSHEESNSGNLTWIAILTLFVAIFIVFDFISIKKLKK